MEHTLREAVILVSMQHFITPALDLMPACPPDEGRRQKGHLIQEGSSQWLH